MFAKGDSPNRGGVQFSSVTRSCLTLCDPMNRSTPGLPVHHQLPESTQTHVYWVGDSIQTSHPLSSPSPPALNLSQHQGLFKWVSSLHQVAKYWNFSFKISPFNEHPGLISYCIWTNTGLVSTKKRKGIHRWGRKQTSFCKLQMMVSGSWRCWCSSGNCRDVEWHFSYSLKT